MSKYHKLTRLIADINGFKGIIIPNDVYEEYDGMIKSEVQKLSNKVANIQGYESSEKVELALGLREKKTLKDRIKEIHPGILDEKAAEIAEEAQKYHENKVRERD